MSKQNITDQAYGEAIKILRRCISPWGFKASAHVHGYPQVWARDSMIVALGALLVDDKKFLGGVKRSIETLRKHQTDLGLIPNNVDVRSGKPNFQAYADSGLWFVFVNIILLKKTKGHSFLKKNYLAVQRVLRWYGHQDAHDSGLIWMHEGADWEDLFAVRGAGLYVNVLYYLALIKMAKAARLMKDTSFSLYCSSHARRLKKQINQRFWYTPKKDFLEILAESFGTEDDINIDRRYRDPLGRKLILPTKKILKRESYYLPYITFRQFGEWFDSFGNLLTILSGVADKKQVEVVLKHIEKFGVAKPYPIKAISPPIFPKDRDWRYYYRFGNLNLPYRYHNGGIWPFLGGFYIAALVKAGRHEKAQRELQSLALLNKRNNWEFNEWFHGKSGEPMGIANQAWSAGMYIYAYEAVRRRKTPFF